MSEIIVAGAGHGGLIAAIRLAGAGHSVTVLEKNSCGEVGRMQKDAFLSTDLENVGLPVPADFRAKKNKLTMIGNGGAVLSLPANDEGNSLWVSRRRLCEYLLRFVAEAGVKIIYSCEVTGVCVLGNRVAGVKTNIGNFYADLIIDACGVDSPVRKNLPPFLFVQNTFGRFDTVCSYRAYFKKRDDVPEPETAYNIHLDRDGIEGFEWVISEKNDADMLILRFDKPTEAEIGGNIAELCEKYPFIDANSMISGEKGKIPVRQPLAVFVADGYAAVGDSACMTVPVKGSGIGNSLAAGKMLADAVIKDKSGFFTAQALWEYEREYFKRIGFDSCRLALVKNALPYIGKNDVEAFLQRGVLNESELELLSADALSALISAKGIAALKEKLRLFSEFPTLKSLALDIARWFGRLAVIEPFLPDEYERDTVEKWAQRYNEFFESIKYTDPEPENGRNG